MVEGPGTTRNAQKACRLIHSKVIHISTVNPSHDTWWTNRELSEVIKIGKELFLVFSLLPRQQCETAWAHQSDQDLAIRLHFGMVGSLQVNNRTESAMPVETTVAPPRRPTAQNFHGCTATLEITFETKVLRTFQTTISSVIPAKGPRVKFTKLSAHDVCSPTFNLNHVMDCLLSPDLKISKDSVISDVLLNQNILPGIGNIIKVEGMHEARIHPNRPLSSLSKEELRNVIICCKEYALKWLITGRAPPKYVYNQTICGSCAGTTIAICRVGGTNRTTFWCTSCVKLRPTASLNTMNNNSFSIAQNAIGTGNNPSTPSAYNILTAATEISDNNMNEESSTIVRNSQNVMRKACSTHGPSTVILRRCKKRGINEQRIFYTCKVRNCNYFHWADTNFPRCKCDKRALLRISKTEKTGGRWFFFCAKRGEKENGCGFFQWAEPKYLDHYGHLLTPLL